MHRSLYVVGIILIVLTIFFIWDCYKPRNPLEKYGVQIQWRVEGPTPAYDRIEVWAKYEEKKIECPIAFGGIEYPRLRFEDCDGDKIPDIIFEDDRYR